ncbi:AAA family ATPase [Vagococcus sp. BWB3-3]|uniref:AAA family ATPase n=1 Tax=Vagococcus allomyrinae TaxID=2794353 RepID=A0A940STZ6_9ENTE|nr:AAA family ATPase [Vagococcus allomyrinae]MBP1040815.1 AAA family ATPase [Vagococcus allomyrinae]
MSKVVYGQLFGNPEIFVDGKLILFSFTKINALLYYMLVNRKVSRDELSALLWPDMDEKNAKKNLRNTIYQANKKLGGDYICSPNKFVLVLSDELPISSDVERFKENPGDSLSLYRDSFLKGFYLKECEEYDLWTEKMRNFFEKKFLNECFRHVTQDMEDGRYEHVEKNLQQLISLDEYDERNYQLLMSYYYEVERHEKVIEVYYDLADVLNTELGIGPSQETRDIFERALIVINKDNPVINRRFKTKFFGRLAEIQLMEINFIHFNRNETSHSILVKGDMGVGKTSLVSRVLDNVPHFHILETQCYEVEKNYDLRAWRKIFNQLSRLIEQEGIMQPDHWHHTLDRFFPNIEDVSQEKPIEDEKHFDLNILSQIMIEAIRKLSLSKKIVLVFENIQWLDDMSFQLLVSAMLHLKNKEAIFIFTSRNEISSRVLTFLTTINCYELLIEISLAPLSLAETQEFSRKELVDHPISQDKLLELYKLTEGNFFFLTEYLNMIRNNDHIDIMNVRMQDTLRDRFSGLSEIETKIIEVVAYFYDYVPVDLLAEIVDLPAIKLAETVEKLVKRNILLELFISDEVMICFSHNRLREFIYMNQMTSKKRLLHKEIAYLMEKSRMSSLNDHLIFAKIAYHYEEAREWLKSVDFQLRYLQSYFKFYHELFPINAVPNDNSMVNPDNWKKGTIKEFEKIRQKLAELEPVYGNDERYLMLGMRFYNMEGRYLIRQGNYEKGVEDIQYVLRVAKELNDSHFLLEGYKQMIYYCIQIDNSREMHDYLELGLSEAIRSNNHESIGILLRLKGLNYLMAGDLFMAERQLIESINTFSITETIKDKYSINIAAAYDYLAEIRSIEENYDEAVRLQQMAIELCENKGAYSSLSVFYINMGIILFGKREYDQAKSFFDKAYHIYEEFSSLWKRPQLDAYMSLINLYQGNYQAVFVYLISSKKYMERFANPRDIGTIYFAEAMIKRQLVKEKHHDNKLWEMLDQDEWFYFRKALEYLSPNRNKLETNLLKRTFKPEEFANGQR